jgi:PAS domain S-box-containing protein
MASPRRHSALPLEGLSHRPFRGLGGWHAAALLQSLRHDEGDDRLAMSAFEHARLLDREPDPDARDHSQSALPLVVGRPWWAGYAVAFVTTALAVGLRVLLDAYLGRGLTFLLAYPPVMISAIYGGLGPALLSTVLSEVMLLALADPTAAEANTPLRMIVFGASGLVIGTMAESLHRARRRAHEASLARGRSERTLESAQDRLRVIVDAAPALISYIDTQLRYRLVNATYEKWFQRPPAEVYGRPVADVLGPAAFELERPHMEAALRGELVSFEKELPYPQGARWVQVTYAPERSRDGRVRGFVAHASDVTARKRAEAALVRSAQQSDGLSRLVGALSGVSAHSDGPGRGSEFVVRLPAAPPEARHSTQPCRPRAPSRCPAAAACSSSTTTSTPPRCSRCCSSLRATRRWSPTTARRRSRCSAASGRRWRSSTSGCR